MLSSPKVQVAFGFTMDLLQGGLLFGWPALSAALGEMNQYSEGCPKSDSFCIEQEERLSFIWTLGVMAVNFGPVFIGPMLDVCGPKYTVLFGTLVNASAVLLLAASDSRTFDGFPAAAVGLGFGGIAYHLSQFHKGDLFPVVKGVVSSLFNAAFSLSACVMPVLLAIARARSPGDSVDPASFRSVMFAYGALLLASIPLVALLEPRYATGCNPHKQEAPTMTEDLSEGVSALEPLMPSTASDETEPLTIRIPGSRPVLRHPDRPSALADAVFDPGSHFSNPLPVSSFGSAKFTFLDSLHGSFKLLPRPLRSGTGAARSEDSNTCPNTPRTPHEASQLAAAPEHAMLPELLVAGAPAALDAAVAQHCNQAVMESQFETLPRADSAPPSHVALTHVQCLSPRWLALRNAPLRVQLRSPECIGICTWLSCSVVLLQFYLGTAREQLALKGDRRHEIADLIEPLLGMGFVAVPLIGWLLDRGGYGATLMVISVGGIACSLLQALPTLWTQVATIALWSVDRFCLYAGTYTMIGTLFGFRNFGRIVALKSVINGCTSFLQYPAHLFVFDTLGGRFWIMNLIQAGIGALALPFCAAMMVWERPDAMPH